ncbi:MAG TPA: DeoR/GlpR family DNA-binding transcription regulator [Microbacteriaceae bacterium]|nr:DeoR/GlpR family DNA-binding transcription regulator [Microbacteriaceae bacterium]
MYAPERQQAILTRARRDGRVEVRSLAEDFNVTPETIRRDLTLMERRGLVQRAHGGAIPMERLSIEPPVADREGLLTSEKERIARAALAEIPENGSVLFDAGTTTARLAELLPTETNLTVVTNSLPIAAQLATRPNIDLHVLGGHVRQLTLATVGAWANETLRKVAVDVAFIGTNGITASRGLTTPDIEEARVKSQLIASARRTVVLADHTKFGREDFGVVAPLAAIDCIITDNELDAELAAEIEAAGVDVVRA